MSKSDEEYIEGMIHASTVAARQGDYQAAQDYRDRANARIRQARRGGE